MLLAAGTRIEDRYEVLGALGRGAMADVYVARHLQLGTVHALKVLQVPTRVIRQRLVVEGRIQGSLRHPHVVAVTDMVEAEGSPALVLELVRGPSLDRLLREVGALPLDVARALGTQILLGVQAAHRAGHVHRDLKPANVLVDVVDGALVAKVTDFGLAKLLLPDDAGATATRTGSTLGTPAYMAPEQIRDARSVDERADVFSLGALLYELVTGARAFDGDDVMEVFDAIRAERAAPIASLRPDAPPALVRAVEGALRADREARTASVDALLAAWTDGQGAEAARLAWPAALVEKATALAVSAEVARPSSASSSTWGGTSVVAEPAAAVAQWVDSPPPPPPRARRPSVSRWLLAGGAAGVAAVAVVSVVGVGLVALLALGWLQVGEDAPTRSDVSSYAAPDPGDPRLAAGRLDLVAAETPALGPPGETAGQCADPAPCLAAAAAALWVEDAHAWRWIALAAEQGRGRGAYERLAGRVARAVTEGLPPEKVARTVGRSPDDTLAVLLLGQVPGIEAGARSRLLEEHCRAWPEEHGPCLALARLELQRGAWDAASTRIDAAIAADPGHVPALALRAELALARGEPDAALRALDGLPPSPFVARVRAAAARAASDVPDPRDAPPGDAASAVAFHVGRAEAAAGLGFVSEAREHLAAAYDVGAPIDTWPAAWLHGELALVTEDPAWLDEASRALRKLAAEDVAAGESVRLNNRADLLDGLRALRAGDDRALEQARKALGDRPSGSRWLAILGTLEQARRGSVPSAAPLETCLFRALQARWLDDAGAAGAEDLLRAVADGPEACGAFGVERWARAEVWVRWAARRHAAGADEDARAGLAAYDHLVRGFEPPFVERAEALRTDLAGP